MDFQTIWTQYKDHLHNFILTKVDDKEEALDILQEVAIKLHKNLEKQTEILNYKNWLFQVTRNTIADHYRKKAKQDHVKMNYANFQVTDYEACACDLAEVVIRMALHKDYSVPLIMSDLYNIPQKEIAQELNLGLSNTKSRIQRARKKLKEQVEGCVDIELNKKGQITNISLKKHCMPKQAIMEEIKKLNLEV